MKRYVVQRDIPGIGHTPTDDWRVAVEKSNGVVAELQPGLQWLHSYITVDGTFCVFLAEDEEQVREHSSRAGLPVTAITESVRVVSPMTAHDAH